LWDDEEEADGEASSARSADGRCDSRGGAISCIWFSGRADRAANMFERGALAVVLEELSSEAVALEDAELSSREDDPRRRSPLPLLLLLLLVLQHASVDRVKPWPGSVGSGNLIKSSSSVSQSSQMRSREQRETCFIHGSEQSSTAVIASWG